MTITVKSRTNVFVMLTTNIWWIIFKKVSIYYTFFVMLFNKNINKKTTHVCHANLEKIVYKTVAW